MANKQKSPLAAYADTLFDSEWKRRLQKRAAALANVGIQSVLDMPTKQAQGKADPVMAGLRPAEGEKSCASCIHFDGSSACDVVEGPVDATMVSDLYEPMPEPNFAGLNKMVQPIGVSPVEGIPEPPEFSV